MAHGAEIGPYLLRLGWGLGARGIMQSPRDFPTLRITREGIRAQGEFARAQADFFDPDSDQVELVDALMREHEVGIVAHFYMDPELQAVLQACDPQRVQISDSLVMADRAVAMANAGARVIIVLGVDFMAENVRAMLDYAGHEDVEVLRVAAAPIGCSLAESADSPAYAAYLERARAQARPLHIIYINTSLATKAHAHERVPTITCTSSNVVRCILTAFAEVPDLSVWFGPDTYMGANLKTMLETYAAASDEDIAKLHPAHDRASLAAALDKFHYFGQGNCIVHHMFGASVVERVRRDYADAEIAAHLEVPGEMFELALVAARENRGVAGSTSDILGYIRRRVEESLARPDEVERLQFILGTEAGMVTSIVRDVRELLAAAPDSTLAVEIVFPVASEAVTVTGDADLPLVPGPAAGEGCTTAGGCATCPYMKMNHLDALVDLMRALKGERTELAGFRPKAYAEPRSGGTVAELGRTPIAHMREFQATQSLGPALRAELDGHQQ